MTSFTPEELKNPWAAAQARTTAGGVHTDDSAGAGIGRVLRGLIDNKATNYAAGTAANVMNRGPLVGGAAGAAGLGLLGYGLGKLWDWRNDDPDAETSNWTGLAGGLLGAGLGAYSGHLRQKNASAFGSDPLSYIQQRMGQDTSLSKRDSDNLLSALSGLSAMQLKRLADLLQVSFGAAVGAVIARFLTNAGIPGMAVGALAGGLVANRMQGPSFLGNAQHLDKTDAYGNPNSL